MTLSKPLVVSPSPHFREKTTTTSIMLDVIIAMMPALIAAVIIFGVRALMLTAICVASCVAFEWLFNLVCKKKATVGDLSAVVTGMLLAFNLPPELPIYIAVIGSFVAIIIAKQLFGGLGCNFANPAILARVALLVSFSQPMTTWLVPTITGGSMELVSGATPLPTLNAVGSLDMSYLDLFLGLGKGGCIGEISGLALILGGLYLVIRRVITPTTTVAFLFTVALFTLVLGQDPGAHLLTGGVLLGAIFMATDYSTSPVTEKGKLIFGIGCGLLTVLIRVYGSYPEGVSFAILLMNIVTPHIDKLTRSTPFGGVIK